MKNDRKCAHTRFFAFLEHFFKTGRGKNLHDGFGIVVLYVII